MNCFCILLACFLNLLTPLQQDANPQTCSQECDGHIYQLSTICTSHQTAQLQCSAGGSCTRRSGWNGIRRSPGETEGNDRDAAWLNEGADCDPWVSQCCGTWAWRSSWKTPMGQRRTGWAWDRDRRSVRGGHITCIQTFCLAIHQIGKKCW